MYPSFPIAGASFQSNGYYTFLKAYFNNYFYVVRKLSEKSDILKQCFNELYLATFL